MAQNSVKKLKQTRVASHDKSRKKTPVNQGWERGESVPCAKDTTERISPLKKK
jgi:hypothetical protein